MRARLIMAALLALLAAAGCGPERSGALWQKPAGEPPAYHQPLAAWRGWHGDLTGFELPEDGPGGGAWFEAGECLACHNLAASCARCHAFMGAPELPVDAWRGGDGQGGES